MSEARFILNGLMDRDRACRLIVQAPAGARVTVKGARRTLPQNDLLWAALTDVARQAEWAGKRRTPDQWKDLFTAAFRSVRDGLEIVPGLEGGFMLLGLHTSDLSKAEMTDLIEYIFAWGAGNGVTFSTPEPADGITSPVPQSAAGAPPRQAERAGRRLSSPVEAAAPARELVS